MVAALLFFPESELRNVASPFSSVMVCMSAPVCLMSPLLSHTARKSARAGHLSKVVPITWCFFSLYGTTSTGCQGGDEEGWFREDGLSVPLGVVKAPLCNQVRLHCMRDAMCFLSPMTPWYLPFNLLESGSQRGATICIASLVQALCVCS